MSASRFLQQAAAGNAGSATYVDDVFSTYLYGKDGNSFSVDNGIDLANEGGLVWIKSRTATNDHHLFNTESGPLKRLYSNSSTNEGTQANTLTSFNSDGFTVGSSSYINSSSYDYTSWTFRKAPGFFDIVTYTGNGSAGQARTLSHNLGSVPGMIIVKSTSNTANWAVYHRGMDSSNPENYSAYLDAANARATSDLFGSTAPTATEFTIGWDGDVNANGYEYVAYLFAHDAQDFGTDSDEAIIKCGSYTGNNSSSTPVTVDLGFEPQFILVKDAQASRDWHIVDNMRGMVVDPSGLTATYLRPNQSASETNTSGSSSLIPTATGFYALGGGNTFNENNQYIYMAIRRPMKPASEFAATDLLGIDNNTGQTGHTTGFATDFGFTSHRTVTDQWYVSSRLTQGKYNSFTSSNAESTQAAFKFDEMEGFFSASGSWNGYIGYGFRRAPGFFDVVAYTGTGGSTNTINHNLGVAPEMMWVKRRDGSDVWWVYHKDMTGTPHNAYIRLGADSAVVTGNDAGFGNVAPTATQFTVGGFPAGSGHAHIAYLFATVDGISKVGTYTGTGSDVNVDCGFSAGARFVLVKRTDSYGDWYLWDSVRGVVAGNDPYFLVNSTAAEVTNTDYIDPLSSGFTITSSAPVALNASSGTYIFLAIA